MGLLYSGKLAYMVTLVKYGKEFEPLYNCSMHNDHSMENYQVADIETPVKASDWVVVSSIVTMIQ